MRACTKISLWKVFSSYVYMYDITRIVHMYLTRWIWTRNICVFWSVSMYVLCVSLSLIAWTRPQNPLSCLSRTWNSSLVCMCVWIYYTCIHIAYLYKFHMYTYIIYILVVYVYILHPMHICHIHILFRGHGTARLYVYLCAYMYHILVYICIHIVSVYIYFTYAYVEMTCLLWQLSSVRRRRRACGNAPPTLASSVLVRKYVYSYIYICMWRRHSYTCKDFYVHTYVLSWIVLMYVCIYICSLMYIYIYIYMYREMAPMVHWRQFWCYIYVYLYVWSVCMRRWFHTLGN